MTSSLEALPAPERQLLAPGPPPKGSAAMKAVLTDERFSAPDWIFERKLDGIRALRCVTARECSCCPATTGRWVAGIRS